MPHCEPLLNWDKPVEVVITVNGFGTPKGVYEAFKCPWSTADIKYLAARNVAYILECYNDGTISSVGYVRNVPETRTKFFRVGLNFSLKGPFDTKEDAINSVANSFPVQYIKVTYKGESVTDVILYTK